jgi:hypothetical protein
MLGKADGLRLLDVSADGFWNSFFAIVVAVPAMVVDWVGITNVVVDPDASGERVETLLSLAAVDIASWIVPIIAFAIVAPRVGLGGRFVHFVVASNWGNAVVAWVLLPAALVRLFLSLNDDTSKTVTLALYAVAAVLTWRLTNAALGKGAAVATAVFIGMFAAMLVVQIALQTLFGINIPE